MIVVNHYDDNIHSNTKAIIKPPKVKNKMDGTHDLEFYTRGIEKCSFARSIKKQVKRLIFDKCQFKVFKSIYSRRLIPGLGLLHFMHYVSLRF